MKYTSLATVRAFNYWAPILFLVQTESRKQRIFYRIFIEHDRQFLGFTCNGGLQL